MEVCGLGRTGGLFCFLTGRWSPRLIATLGLGKKMGILGNGSLTSLTSSPPTPSLPGKLRGLLYLFSQLYIQTLQKGTWVTSVSDFSSLPLELEKVCMPPWARLTSQLKVIAEERREGKLHLEALTLSARALTKSLNLHFCIISTHNTMVSESADLPKSSKYKIHIIIRLPTTYINQPPNTCT